MLVARHDDDDNHMQIIIKLINLTDKRGPTGQSELGTNGKEDLVLVCFFYLMAYQPSQIS